MKKMLLIFVFLFSMNLAIANDIVGSVTVISVTDSNIMKLTRKELRALYLMRTRYSDNGLRLTLFQFPNESDIHIRFIKEVLDLTASEYEREMSKVTNSGSSTNNTIIAKSKIEMIRMVSSTYNSIGYLDSLTFLINFGDFDVKKILVTD